MTFKLHLVEKTQKNKPQEKLLNIQPDSFIVCEEGVIYCNEEMHFHKLCDLLLVSRGGHKKNGRGHYIQLEWLSYINKKRHAYKMPFKLLAGDGKEIWEKLLDQGLRITPGTEARTRLMEYIQFMKPIILDKPLAEYANVDSK